MWKIHDDLPVGVYPVRPVSRTWTVNLRNKVKVRRTGFCLVADFASTAHMIHCQNLDALFANIMNESFTDKVTEQSQMMGYVMLSRAKFADKVWVMNPFLPHLFAQGPPHGPHV